MNPIALIPPSSPLGFPAPYWFLVLFKIIGFVLHMIMMNLWFAGPIIALIIWSREGHTRTLASRLMKQMPIIIAYGVNFGIVPLLFVQVAYYKVFYPSTILMAWPWFSVFILLTFAYYGSYIYSSSAYREEGLSPFQRAAGWISAILFIAIGFIFTNEFSLMTNVDKWQVLWKDSNIAGAVLGLASNVTDPTFWPRWLMIFGLAITTTSAYMAVDSGLFQKNTTYDYRQWAPGFAMKAYLIGMIWFAAFGSWYVFGTWIPAIRNEMFSGSNQILTILTAISPGLPYILIIFAARKAPISRFLAVIIALAQIFMLTLNAISRQIVQNFEIGQYFNIRSEKVNMQWSPLIVFLLLFIFGVILIIWMLRQAAIQIKDEPTKLKDISQPLT